MNTNVIIERLEELIIEGNNIIIEVISLKEEDEDDESIYSKGDMVMNKFDAWVKFTVKFANNVIPAFLNELVEEYKLDLKDPLSLPFIIKIIEEIKFEININQKL